jgi:hypothetical protein
MHKYFFILYHNLQSFTLFPIVKKKEFRQKQFYKVIYTQPVIFLCVHWYSPYTPKIAKFGVLSKIITHMLYLQEPHYHMDILTQDTLTQDDDIVNTTLATFLSDKELPVQIKFLPSTEPKSWVHYFLNKFFWPVNCKILAMMICACAFWRKIQELPFCLVFVYPNRPSKAATYVHILSVHFLVKVYLLNFTTVVESF